MYLFIKVNLLWAIGMSSRGVPIIRLAIWGELELFRGLDRRIIVALMNHKPEHLAWLHPMIEGIDNWLMAFLGLLFLIMHVTKQDKRMKI